MKIKNGQEDGGKVVGGGEEVMEEKEEQEQRRRMDANSEAGSICQEMELVCVFPGGPDR